VFHWVQWDFVKPFTSLLTSLHSTVKISLVDDVTLSGEQKADIDVSTILNASLAADLQLNEPKYEDIMEDFTAIFSSPPLNYVT